MPKGNTTVLKLTINGNETQIEYPSMKAALDAVKLWRKMNGVSSKIKVIN